MEFNDALPNILFSLNNCKNGFFMDFSEDYKEDEIGKYLNPVIS